MIKILDIKSYNRQDIKNQLEELLEKEGLFSLLEKNCSILLKPNFVVPSPSSDPSCTHPDFYMAVAELFLDRGHKVGIGESPAFGSCHKALKAHGVYAEVKKLGIEVVEFKHNEAYAGLKTQKKYSSLAIAQELKNWDRLINLPKLKVHQQMHFTGACKNLYGCVAGKRKIVLHNLCENDPVKFAEMILANARKAQAILHIGDGIQAMHVKGPRGGQTHPFGKVIISDNPLQHDYIFARMANYNLLETPLFAALPEEMFNQIEKSCEIIEQSPEFSNAEDFKHSYINDISFAPPQLARSIFRSMKFKFTGKL